MSDVSSQPKLTIPLAPHLDEVDGLNDDDVRKFLLKHPDFFTRNPDLAERLKIPHVHKGTVSLVELQGEQLRKKLRQLTYKLSQLIGVAKQNERIYRVYADLNIQLLHCEDFHKVQYVLEEILQERLNLTAALIKPFKGPFAIPELQRRLFLEKRFSSGPYFFGRLSQHERHLLFGAQTAESAALVLLGENPHLGILAVGSADPGHFTPDMDTLLLEQLRQVLNLVLPAKLAY